MKLKSLFESGDPEKIGADYQFTEGPVWHTDGYLLFSDIHASRIYCWKDGQAEVYREPSGNSNGLTLDTQHRLIACEHGNRRVSREESDGSVVTLADSYEGGRLNSPNDVVVRSDGSIYFTDPSYGIQPEQREQPCNGVYRILPDGTLIRILDDLVRPNGLAFSPDESRLYVCDSGQRKVVTYDVSEDGSLAITPVEFDMDHPQPGSPDGMKLDVEGHLYVAGPNGVWVFEPDGTHLGVIWLPERPTNLAWGDDDRQTLYITARTTMYKVRTQIPGCPIIA